MMQSIYSASDISDISDSRSGTDYRRSSIRGDYLQ